MRNIIATWICLDSAEGATYFPSAKGNSSDAAVQNIYWRCICCFFTTARNFNPDAELMLFSNTADLPDVDGTSVGSLLGDLQVQIHVTPFEFRTPPGYWNQWRNQFFEFSIFKYVSEHSDFKEDDRLLLLDSDCIINTELSALFAAVGQSGCITYHIDYLPEHVINGCSRKDMQFVFRELLHEEVREIPNYHGGEFFAATIAVVRQVSKDFSVLWQELLKRHARGLKKLNEEAHVLSFLFYKNNITGGQANRFIKRIWTDPASFRNVIPGDQYLAIWHLPAEKRSGFPAYFRFLQHINFRLSEIAQEVVLLRLQKIFLVPAIPMHRQPYYLGKALFKKILSRS